MKFQQFFLAGFVTASLLSASVAQAKVWRVNNNAGVNADFNNLATAFTTALQGDTLYLEASATSYSGNQSKRLVIIGPGYFLSGTGGNAGLQANPHAATLSLNVDSLGTGSQYIGLSFTSFNPTGGVDVITMTRCYVQSLNTFSTGTCANWKVSQCYLVSMDMFNPTLNWSVTNNIITNRFNLSAGQNCLVRNNVFRNAAININSAYFSNNILLNCSLASVNSSIRYNLATNSVLPGGNNNQNNLAQNTLVVETGSTDGYYKLPAGSPAIAAGEPIEGITPDAGPFGTDTPYWLSGIPPLPTIYALTVPASIPSNATTINVTLSTRSNN